MSYTRTEEQDKIVAAALTGESVVIEAGAGCGKTSVLVDIDKAKPKYESGVYVAYNRSIAGDAKRKFSRRTHSATAHSFAFRAVGVKFKDRLNGPRVSAKQSAYILGINSGVSFDSEANYSPEKLARLALGTVTKFCYSADIAIKPRHVPWIPGAEAYFDELAQLVTPYAQRAWEDLTNVNGRLRFMHDIYLKLWALGHPTLPGDFVLLDEAQDANPCIEHVVKNQDAQVIMVGDSAQQIYAWRGAEDALARFHAKHRLTLSQSFRFGPAVAEEANKWLELIHAPLRLRGYDQINSEIVSIDDPRTILCRTNASVVAEALHAQEEQNKTVAIVGGTNEIKMFAEAARDLQSGNSTSHPELLGFNTWGDVQEYVQDDAGSDLKVFVNLIDTYGVEKVITVASSAVDEKYADVIVSTAHKAKGREWDAVKIGPDFREPMNEDGSPSDPVKSECMLAYVSVTRAMERLDRGSLSWIDGFMPPVEKVTIPRAQRIMRERRAHQIGE